MERGVRQVNSLAYKLTKAQQIPKTSTYKLKKITNLLTHQLANSKTY